jgi:hypothetical protein
VQRGSHPDMPVASALLIRLELAQLRPAADRFHRSCQGCPHKRARTVRRPCNPIRPGQVIPLDRMRRDF